MSVDPWQEGTATYYVARMENYGAAGMFSDAIFWATSLTLVALLTSWGAVVTEFLIAVLTLRTYRARRASPGAPDEVPVTRAV